MHTDLLSVVLDQVNCAEASDSSASDGEELAETCVASLPEGGPWEAGGFHFFSSFDSGNCASVVALPPETKDPQEVEAPAEEVCHSFEVCPRADCQGTSFAQADCQWFYFGMKGTFTKGMRLRFHVLGLSRFKDMDCAAADTRFITDLLKPVVLAPKFAGAWTVVNDEGSVRERPGGVRAFTFEHVLEADEQELYFAQCFPYPLRAIRLHLAGLCKRLVEGGCYVHRERLTESLGGRPVELLTITKAGGRSSHRQPALRGLPPRGRRPRVFSGRRAVFISARVHPGETPASFVLEGLLEYLASGSPAADRLLENYVFHVVPVLNPDGVELGHHRTDTRGENLNRVYSRASLKAHPSIFAAQAACASAHKHQHGLRLYLDLHAHSTRRGAFLLADGVGARVQAAARLFGYALARRSSLLEFAQCDFSDHVPGTGKSAALTGTGVPLCYTLETNYTRGHHDIMPFKPHQWRKLGRACLLALLDLDSLESPSPHISNDELRRDLKVAASWLDSEARGEKRGRLHLEGPSRAKPFFAIVRGPQIGHEPSEQLLAKPGLMGTEVEVVERRDAPDGADGLRICRLHECDGGFWLPQTDLIFRPSQTGRFYYGALSRVKISSEAVASSVGCFEVLPGTVLLVEERRVVGGVLRLKIAQTFPGPSVSGWASEYRQVKFDPRLGGQVQLMRLNGPPLAWVNAVQFAH